MATKVYRIGLTELYKPRNGTEPNLDIVFVHGLFGHPRTTWTSDTTVPEDDDDTQGRGREGGLHNNVDGRQRRKAIFRRKQQYQEVFWPQDLLPVAMPHARILTWGYDVQIEHIFSPISQASVFQHAETLLLDLATTRKRTVDKARPIIFVAHSLGGIVVKDALALSKNEKTFVNEILPATTGVCFLGTPHRGSKVASLGKIAFEVSKVFLQDPNLRVLRTLELNAEVLDRVARGFCHILQDEMIKVHSFREELQTKGIMIVDEFSSSIGHALETRGMIHANHRDIARFSSQQDNGFQRVVNVLQRWDQDLHRQTKDSEALEMGGYENAAQIRAAEVDQRMDDTVRIDCLKSLDTCEVRLRIASVEDSFQSTSKWLFEDKVGFENWLRGKTDNNIYWIHGKPGSGKSTIMKFAMNHGQTKHLLNEYNDSHWIIAGFFFSDRGSVIQKSIEGLIQELLFQILQQRQDLIQLVLRVHPADFKLVDLEDEAEPQDKPSRPRSLFPMRKTLERIAWVSHDVKEALLLIASQDVSNVNACVFIDALDEHSGDHRELLELIHRLEKCTKNPNSRFRLRLCLASRSENIFRSAFGSCPGFAIHNQTEEDIRQFVLGKMQPELNGDLSGETIYQLNRLLEDILNLAQGVFIWVKLVVAELIEGLGEGDNIVELRETLSTIPSELEGLFQRAIRRCHRSSARAHKRIKYEAYIMYQIALYSYSPLSIDEFLQISASLALENMQRTEMTEQSSLQMLRRLESRSSGLLEIGANDNRVQFIHQSVMEFMRSGKGTAALYENEKDVPQETGHLLLLRYYFHQSLRVVSQTGVEHLFYHARCHEATTGAASLEILREFLKRGKDSDITSLLFLCEILKAMCAHAELCEAVQETDDSSVALLIIALYGGLLTSLNEWLRTDTASRVHHGGLLLASALCESLHQKTGIASAGRPNDPELISAILQAGVKADCAFRSITPLVRLFLYSFCNAYQPLRLLCERMDFLMERGGDPNQSVPKGLWSVSKGHTYRDVLLIGMRLPENDKPSIRDLRESTLLFYAIVKNSRIRVKVLSDYGADPSRLNDFGLSAWDPAAEALEVNELDCNISDIKFYCGEMMDLLPKNVGSSTSEMNIGEAPGSHVQRISAM